MVLELINAQIPEASPRHFVCLAVRTQEKSASFDTPKLLKSLASGS